MNTRTVVETPIPEREAQALREVGTTRIGPWTAILLSFAVLGTISAVPLFQALADLRNPAADRLAPRLVRLASDAAGTVTLLRTSGFLAVNRGLQDAVDSFETRVEEESILRDRILPPAQRVLTDFLGVGNEQAYLGREGWLFYREDFEHVAGRAFLDVEALEDSERSADPLPAIRELQAELARRGAALVILPTPVKPTLHPERFAARANPRAALHNRSYPEFLDRLRSSGVEFLDPSAPLLEAKLRSGEPLFLRSDTHWTPEAMDLVARALADRANHLVAWNRPRREFRRRETPVVGSGDITAMLKMSHIERRFPSERVVTSRVVGSDGRSWRSSPDAELLVLGDSFTNVYSDPGLGWGAGAGLAEQLSFHLQRPVDRVAVNAGGALSSRQALARALEGDPARLGATRIVVYQFAARELSTGDWQVVPLP